MCSTSMCYVTTTHIKGYVCMKKALLVFAATTALWAALAGSLVYTNVLYVLTRSDMTNIEEAFAGLYQKGMEAYVAYMKCRNST